MSNKTDYNYFKEMKEDSYADLMSDIRNVERYLARVKEKLKHLEDKLIT